MLSRRKVSRVAGQLAKLDARGGNGIAGRIFLNGNPLYAQYISGQDGLGADYHLILSIRRDGKLDFMLDPWQADDLCDSSEFTAHISTVPEPSSLVLLGIGAISLFAWRRRKRTA